MVAHDRCGIAFNTGEGVYGSRHSPGRRGTSIAAISFSEHEKVFSETGATPSRNSARRRRNRCPGDTRHRNRRRMSAGPSMHRETDMSKRFALLSAVAFSALAITATVVAPATAEDKKMMKSELSGE